MKVWLNTLINWDKGESASAVFASGQDAKNDIFRYLTDQLKDNDMIHPDYASAIQQAMNRENLDQALSVYHEAQDKRQVTCEEKQVL